MNSKRKQSKTFHELMNSPQFRPNKVMEIESIPFYRKIERPNLKSSKLKSITDQLQLQQKSKLEHQLRQANEDLIFGYDYNPFTRDFENEEKEEILLSRPDRSKKKKVGKEEGKGDFRKMRSLIDQIRQHKSRLQQNRIDLLKMFNNFQQSEQKRNKKIRQMKSFQSQLKNANPLLQSIFQRLPLLLHENKQPIEEEISFTNILQIREKNYYQQTLVIDNIFKFRRDPELMNNAGRKILDRYYFCHNSMKDIVQKGKIYIYRDISRFSRLLMLEREVSEDKPSFMSPKELSPNLHVIQEMDAVLGISSGRIKSKQLAPAFQYEIKTGKQDDNSSIQQQQQPIDYPQNTQNFLMNKQDQFDAANQALQFTNVPLGQRQKTYKRRLNAQFLHYNEIIAEQQRIISLNIKDEGLKRRVESQKREKQGKLFDCRVVDADIDRLIRKNKIFKDRCEQMHVKKLVEVIKANKAANPRKSKSKSRSKSQSKSNSKPTTPTNEKHKKATQSKSPIRQK